MSQVVLYIATSIDGYIAGPEHQLDFLENIPNPDEDDHGYSEFYHSVDALIMGSGTYEVISGFGIDWPYQGKSSFILTSDKTLSSDTEDIQFYNGSVTELTDNLKNTCENNIWLVGGGKVVSYFLQNNLVDKMIVSIAPVVLGKGIKLFPEETPEVSFKLQQAMSFASGMVQCVWVQN